MTQLVLSVNASGFALVSEDDVAYPCVYAVGGLVLVVVPLSVHDDVVAAPKLIACAVHKGEDVASAAEVVDRIVRSRLIYGDKLHGVDHLYKLYRFQLCGAEGIIISLRYSEGRDDRYIEVV